MVWLQYETHNARDDDNDRLHCILWSFGELSSDVNTSIWGLEPASNAIGGEEGPGNSVPMSTVPFLESVIPDGDGVIQYRNQHFRVTDLVCATQQKDHMEEMSWSFVKCLGNRARTVVHDCRALQQQRAIATAHCHTSPSCVVRNDPKSTAC